MTYYAALDVSLRSVAICIVDDQGEIYLEESVDSDVEDIVHCFVRFGQPIQSVGLEAGTLTQYLAYGLQRAGFEVVCMEARQVKNTLSAMRNKTDRNDARGIAQILRTGWYQQVHVKSIESHHIRALLTSRRTVLQKCMDLENEVRGLLKIFGLKLPSRVNRGAFNQVIQERISGDEALCQALVPLLEARQVLYITYLELDRRAKRRARENEICQRFMTTPDVGPITALTFKAAVDDPARFKRSRTSRPLRSHPQTVPIWRNRQPRTHHQGGRSQRAFCVVYRSSRHDDPIHRMVIAQGLGHEADEKQRSP